MNNYWYGFASGVSTGLAGFALAAGKPVLGIGALAVAVCVPILRAFSERKQGL